MEQEGKQKTGMGLLGGVVGAMFLCLVLAVLAAGGWGRTVTASAPAELEAVPKTAPAVEALAVGDRVIPLGRAVGIKLFSDGVLVVGLSPVETGAGACYPGRDCGLKAGDLITHIDGEEVDTIEEVQALVTQGEGEPLTIQAMRGQKQVQLKAAAVANSQGVYQLGVWLRDSMAGIGTMTFYDPETGAFGALGHGVNDVDTAMLMPLEKGSIMAATVSEVKKGTCGQPGELHGQFDLTGDLGALFANTERGIFGRLENCAMAEGLAPVEVASRKEVREGEATILSNVRGDRVEEFQVEITHVENKKGNSRSLMLRVTDPELLAVTGGIVQGMSGSPIIQDGKLVGAVTHVLVNDPTRGYGIFIENMLEAAG